MRLRLALCAVALFASGCVVDLPDRALDGGRPGDGQVKDGSSKTDKPKLDPNCGNGKLDPGERCDIALGVGDAGACPKSCDDGLACTKDAVQDAATCAATCTFTPITTCVSGDGCCPSGCNASSDDDCSKDCGNGAIDDKETCDTAIAAGQAGACPTACDDQISCTTDLLLNGATCAAQCTYTAIKTCTNGDGCCPTGCNSGNDDDCSPGCNNGVLDEGEKCDTAIAAGQPGACPTDCSDGNACTTDTLLNAGTCNAQCQSAAVQQCKDGDNCCPSGCNNNTDKDCSASCGNGAVEGNEKCDTAIAAGQPGACPTSCNDSDACTVDTLLNPGACNAQCSYSQIAQCKNGDGCCPSGCTANNDDDCSASCGNGAVEPPELCDTGISSGTGKCPTSCNDGNDCTIDTLQNGGTCSAKCTTSTITSCKSNDGCCPAGCNNNNDNDCPVVCGNNAVESGEKCDGNCPTSCSPLTCKAGSVSGSGCQRECVYSDLAAGTACTGGKCYSGSCCTGCWTGSACNTGTTTSTCGDNGANCTTCSTSDPCETASCSTGTCTTTNKTNGTACPGGQCLSGTCCTGCSSGASCLAGTSTTYCGSGGTSCSTCTAGTCKTPTCTSGSCGTANASNGTSCTGGKCYNGSCCTGCVTGTTCYTGTTSSQCGDNGATCGTCTTTNPCKTASCSTGACVLSNVADGATCPSGKCYAGSCCTGCWDATGGFCEPGFEIFACGNGGSLCKHCTAIQCCTFDGYCMKDLGQPECMLR